MWKDMLLNAYLIVMVATLCNQWFKIRVYPPIVFMCWSSHCLFHNFSLRTQQLQNSYGSTDSKLPAYCPPPPHHHLPLGLTLVTPPLEKSTKRPLCESTETWVILLYIMVFSHCHTTAHTHAQSRPAGAVHSAHWPSASPFGPWHDAQTTHCTARPISPKVNVNMQIWHQLCRQFTMYNTTPS